MSPQADINFERELWEPAVTLRGTVAPADYKHYVLPLLFLRYEQRKQTLGLSDEELGFYDVVCLGAQLGVPTDDAWIAGLVHQVVEAVRANLKVDWTQAHRRDVHASVQSAVNRVLRKNHVRGEAFTFLQKRLMQQAEATYEQWPLAA